MDSGIRRRGWAPRTAVLTLVVGALAAAAAYAGTSGAGGTAAPAQDLIRVESRLTQLEQRIYAIESSVRGLEQQSRLAGAGAGAGRATTTRDTEVSLLRTELETMRRRLAEVECGLAKVDERTLTPLARAARRQSESAADDPCRINPDAPLRLSSRP